MFRTESEFVRWLARKAPGSGGRLRLGIGDDAALVEVARGQSLILTTDLSIEDVHFTRRLHPPRAIGHRALARSLSDIAAMGGTPRYALVSLAIPRGTSRAWMDQVYAGMLALARRFAVKLIGGDTARAPAQAMLDVVVAGEVPRGRELLRSGARPGDRIFVSGRLGLSALGLRLLRTKRRGTARRAPTEAIAKAAMQAHLFPEPQCALGRFLSSHGLASALMDISDGLSSDLARLCEASGVGARLWRERIPGVNLEDAEASLRLALHGGEDYQLLFTVPPRKLSRLPAKFGSLPLHLIGQIRKGRGMRLERAEGETEPLQPGGWDCFRK